MEYKLLSMEDAFKGKYRARRRDFPLYAFILSDLSHRDLMTPLIKSFSEIDRVTGSQILVIAASTIKTSESMQTFTSDNNAVDEWLEKQGNESNKFANRIGLKLSDLPSIVFFDTLENTDQYLLWKLRGYNAQQVVDIFRHITDLVEKPLPERTQPNPSGSQLLAAIEREQIATISRRFINSIPAEAIVGAASIALNVYMGLN